MDTKQVAQDTLDRMQAAGFDDAQVSASSSAQDELNMAHNEPSLLRSTQSHTLSLLGLLDGRKASTQLTDTSDEAIGQAVTSLFNGVQVAPQDDANAVSARQSATIVQGPQQGELDVLADKVSEILAYRGAHTPKMNLDEGASAYTHVVSDTLTSRGSALASRVGFYSLSVMGTAKEGKQSSSFNYTGGSCHDLGAHACELFGIRQMLCDTQRQIHTQGIAAPFTGDVILAPAAVLDLMDWLRSQLTDYHLIAGSSLYRDSVGETIASPLLSLRSRFDAPGVCAISADAFSVAPITLLDGGRLTTLLPSLYGSRKTGIAHVASLGEGWTIDSGNASLEELIGNVECGALVGRLSMGSPAANGDFSGVIKNSFTIQHGQAGQALAEVMVTGNVARMLRDIVAVSKERIDTGSSCYPWLHIANLHFS